MTYGSHAAYYLVTTPDGVAYRAFDGKELDTYMESAMVTRYQPQQVKVTVVYANK